MRRLATLPAAMLASAAILASVAVPAAAQQDQTVAGWALRCEAQGCRASLPSASGLQALTFARLPGQDGLALGFAAPTAIPDRERPVNLRLDGRPLATLAPERGYQPFERPEAFWILDARAVTSILQAAGAGRTLRVEYLDVTGAPHDADFALDGLAALIAATDDRLGGKVRREGTAPKGLAAAPQVAKSDLVARQGLPARLLERHRDASDCEDPQSALLKPLAPVIGPLSKTAMLYAIPCTSSAGQVSYKLWVVESGEIGGTTPLFFALHDPVFGWRGTDLLPNVAYEPAATRLTARSTARSDTGCGTYGVWRWKNYGFALEEFRAASDCRGSRDPSDWPRIFPIR